MVKENGQLVEKEGRREKERKEKRKGGYNIGLRRGS